MYLVDEVDEVDDRCCRESEFPMKTYSERKLDDLKFHKDISIYRYIYIYIYI